MAERYVPSSGNVKMCVNCGVLVEDEEAHNLLHEAGLYR